MPRLQTLRSGGIVTCAVAGTSYPLSSVDRYVKSVQITATPSNTDFIYVGDNVTQGNPLEPRRTCEIQGDPMDHGGGAMINLANVYVRANVNNESVSYIYLEGL